MSPPMAASFIPDDSLDNRYISAKLKEVESCIPKHLADMFDRAKENISQREQIALGLLICGYTNVFSTGSRDLGKFTLIRHRINTFNEELVREILRPTPLKCQGEEEKTLTDMLEAHVIKPSTSDWASAPVLVRKKDGDVRYTVDYRQLNVKTIKDAYQDLTRFNKIAT